MAPSGDPAGMHWAHLVSACAHDRTNAVLWTEFLRRYAPKIELFIRGTWRVSIMNSSPFADGALGGTQASDLLQSTVLRLVEHDCAAMKRFSGDSEDEWLAYLAVITRSVVRNVLKHQRRVKRGGKAEIRAFPSHGDEGELVREGGSDHVAMERNLLAQEIRELSEQSIQNSDQEYSARNLLIFQLYFNHDLSAEQIAGCQGVNLSRAGVAKVIDRLKERIRGIVTERSARAVSR